MKAYNDFQIQHEGSSALPLTGGTDTFTRTAIPRSEERSYFTVSFYDSEALTNRVEATAGTVQIVGSADEQMIWKTISDGAFNAADAYDEDVAIPYAEGPMSNCAVRFNNVTGATHARVFINKY